MVWIVGIVVIGLIGVGLYWGLRSGLDTVAPPHLVLERAARTADGRFRITRADYDSLRAATDLPLDGLRITCELPHPRFGPNSFFDGVVKVTDAGPVVEPVGMADMQM